MKTVVKEQHEIANEMLDRNKTIIETSKAKIALKFTIFVLITFVVVIISSKIDLEQLREQIQQWGVWTSVLIFGLRFTSVVFPALPGTAYSVFAGSLLGFVPGMITICLADLCSCSLSFYLSRQYSRDLIAKLVSDRFMLRIDRLSQKHLENNFFLMTGCLMTGFFDFVCYAVGLTKTSWKKFIPALIISILISNLPIVAVGAGVFEGGKMMLGMAILGCFSLGAMSYFLKRKQVFS